ncbi:MAG: hypothetical protein GXO25_01350 [Euryarchaeota archaeon]|nr:hypothetical protein [Euryarchaeota archaeon]
MADVSELRGKIEGMIKAGDYQAAMEIIEREMQDVTEPFDQGLLLYEKASALYYMHRHSEAMIYFAKALGVLEGLETKEAGEIMFHIGAFYLLNGDLETSKAIYQKVVKLLPEGSRYYFGAMHNLGDIYKKSGELDNAKQLFMALVEEAEKHNDLKAAAYASENLAEVYAVSGNREMSLKWLNKAMDYAKRIGEERIVFAGELAMKIMNDARIEEILEMGKSIKGQDMVYAHDVADVYMIFSFLRPAHERRRLVEEALLLYEETGDGIMHQKAVDILNDMD